MVRTWQDFDANCRETWGHWFGTHSIDGHVDLIVGPFATQAEAYAAAGGI